MALPSEAFWLVLVHAGITVVTQHAAEREREKTEEKEREKQRNSEGRGCWFPCGAHEWVGGVGFHTVRMISSKNHRSVRLCWDRLGLRDGQVPRVLGGRRRISILRFATHCPPPLGAGPTADSAGPSSSPRSDRAWRVAGTGSGSAAASAKKETGKINKFVAWLFFVARTSTAAYAQPRCAGPSWGLEELLALVALLALV